MTPPTTLPSAVLLDWDNTLVDSWPNMYESLRETFLAMNHPPWTLEETKQRVHLSLRDSFPVLFGDDWQRAMKIYYEAYERRHPDKLIPLPDAEKLLNELRAKEIYVALVSNKTGRYLRIEVEYLGWQDYFGAMVGAGDAARDKPAREAADMALAGSDILPGSTIWFVGDSAADMEIAHNAGCLPVLLRENLPAVDEFAQHPPAWYISSCGELAAHIVGL
jgi:phosphoglycolate phosphatase